MKMTKRVNTTMKGRREGVGTLARRMSMSASHSVNLSLI